jgi:hypothetical protein
MKEDMRVEVGVEVKADAQTKAPIATPKPRAVVSPPLRPKFPDSKVVDLVLAWRSHVLKRSLPPLVPPASPATQQPVRSVVTERVVAELAAALKCSGAALHAHLAEAIAYLDSNHAGAVVGVLTGGDGVDRLVTDFELAALQEQRSASYTPAAAERQFNTIVGAMEYQRSVKSAMAEREAARSFKSPDGQTDPVGGDAVVGAGAEEDTEAELEELFPLHPSAGPLSFAPDDFGPRALSTFSERTVESRSSRASGTSAPDLFRMDSKEYLLDGSRQSSPRPFDLERKDSTCDDDVLMSSAHWDGLEGLEVAEEEGLEAHWEAMQKGAEEQSQEGSPEESPEEFPVYDEESFEAYAED